MHGTVGAVAGRALPFLYRVVVVFVCREVLLDIDKLFLSTEDYALVVAA